MPSKLVAKFAFSLLLLIPLYADAELKAGRYFQAIAGNKAIVRTLWYQSGQKQQTIVATTTMRSGDDSDTYFPSQATSARMMDSPVTKSKLAAKNHQIQSFTGIPQNLSYG